MNKSSSQYKGKYQQLNLVGKGKYGIIYRVKRLSDSKQYVAKHISLDQIQQEVAKKQLQIIQNLRHPYIVQYIDSFVCQSDFIIIMQYCKEKDLTHHIQLIKSKQKHFNQNLIITWLFQLVLAIQFIHSKKILHRDIKPQNVFVDQNLNIKIGDFGISKILNATGDHCKTMVGTPYYMAPEICAEDKYTTKADIWSLGCVMYQICALQRPIQAKGGIFQLIQEIKFGKIKEIPEIYSSDLRKLVLKMMTRDQAKRPNTTQLLKDPLLVDLMIKNSSSMSLRQQYTKNIQKSKTLSDSFIDRQTDLVHEQLKRFEQEVKLKMEGLKNKDVNSNQVDQNYNQIKKKMADIQKAIGHAFIQLKKKTVQDKSISKQSQPKDNNVIKNNSSLSNSSDMTIIQSVMIGQSKNVSSAKKKAQQQIIADSASYESVPINSSRRNVQFQNNESMISAQSILVTQSQDFSSTYKSLKLNSQMMNKQLHQQSMDKTLMSQYQNTIKQSQGILSKQTINKLQFLQKTLSQNPDAVLNGSLLNYTLTMSQDELKGISKGHPLNALSLKLKSNQNLQDTVSFDLTKRQSDSSSSYHAQGAFLKKTKRQAVLEQKNQKQIQNDYGNQQFQEYTNEQFQEYTEGQQLQSSSMPSMKQKRKSQLNTIISFYQQTLQSFNQSELEMQSPTQKMRQKYPLNMSEIKEQLGEAGSILSRQNSSQGNNSSKF